MGLLSNLFGSEEPDFLFSDAPSTACFTCKHVVQEGRPVLHVTHDADDGSWQFLCGGDHTEEDAMILSLEQMVKIDPSLNGLHEMPLGIGAFRESTNGEWKPFKAG